MEPASRSGTVSSSMRPCILHTARSMRGLVIIAVLLSLPGSAGADVSKLGKESVGVSPRRHAPLRDKVCCGYPLSEERGFALRFYWLANEADYLDEYDRTDV